jgi:hypothetical protein
MKDYERVDRIKTRLLDRLETILKLPVHDVNEVKLYEACRNLAAALRDLEQYYPRDTVE